MMAKTGSMVSAIEIKNHFKALEVLDVDENESSIIIRRLIEKGFSILEVSLAVRFFHSICILRSYSHVNAGIIP